MDEPKAEGNGDHPEQEESRIIGNSGQLPEPKSDSEANNTAKERHSRQHVMRSLETVGRYIGIINGKLWRGLKVGFNFADAHDGAITALATVAIVVLTYSYVSYSKKQWEEMRNSRRPWLGISDLLILRRQPSFDVVSNFNGKISIRVEFDLGGTVQNFGTSPARKVYESFEFLSAAEASKIFREGQCIVAVGESTGKNPFPDMLNLGERLDQQIWSQPTTAIFPTIQIPIKISDVTSAVFVDGPDYKFPYPLWIVGCVAYQDSFNEIHRTKVLYRSVISNTGPELVINNPAFYYTPITEFVMEDSDSD
jgi:hypothetical protein